MLSERCVELKERSITRNQVVKVSAVRCCILILLYMYTYEGVVVSAQEMKQNTARSLGNRRKESFMFFIWWNQRLVYNLSKVFKDLMRSILILSISSTNNIINTNRGRMKKNLPYAKWVLRIILYTYEFSTFLTPKRFCYKLTLRNSQYSLLSNPL